MRRAVATCGFVVLALGITLDGQAQRPTEAELFKRAADLAVKATEVMLQPVVDALRLRTRDNAEIQGLLGKVTVAASPRLLGKGNASASGIQRPLVAVDMSLVNEVNSLAKLNVVQIMGLAKAREIHREAGFRYGQALGAAIKAGTPLPEFVFDPKDYLTDRLELETVRVLSVNLGESTLAWVVLHELGHHVLGHTKRKPKDLAESRADELRADTWAFTEMQRIGTPLFGANRFMLARATMETVEQMFGAVPEEALSTHPTWSRRQAELVRQFDVARMPPEPQRMFSSVVSWQELGKAAEIVKVILAGPPGCGPQNGMWIGVIGLRGRSDPAICEERDGKVWLYQRGPAARVEISIETPNAFVTQVRMRSIGVTGNRDGQAVESSFPALRHSFAFALADVGLGGLTVDALTQTTPLSFFGDVLTRINVTTPTRTAVLSVARRCIVEQGDLALGYSKNVIHTLDDLQARATTSQNACQAELHKILGPEMSARFQAAMFESPLAQAGLTHLIRGVAGNESPAARPPAPAGTPKPAPQPTPGRGRQLSQERVIYQPTKDSARELLAQFVEPGADAATLTALVRPALEDYARIFNEPVATELYQAQRQLFASEVVRPSESDQTSVLISIGSTNDLIDLTPNAEVFAGGWASLRPHLKRDVPVVVFSFVRPGQTSGMRYEGLFFIGGRWVLVPKPWQFIKRAP